jgi:hypothetical protein
MTGHHAPSTRRHDFYVNENTSRKQDRDLVAPGVYVLSNST